MPETFNFVVKNGVRISSQPKVATLSFGDGYDQRRPKGLNNNFPKYRVIVPVSGEEISLVTAFFERHGAVDWFYWTPARKPQARFVCDKWDTDDRTTTAIITAVFREVLA